MWKGIYRHGDKLLAGCLTLLIALNALAPSWLKFLGRLGEQGLDFGISCALLAHVLLVKAAPPPTLLPPPPADRRGDPARVGPP
jgi:hypothetical protein